MNDGNMEIGNIVDKTRQIIKNNMKFALFKSNCDDCSKRSSGPKVVSKPQENERLNDAVQRCKFSKKGLRF